MTGIFPYTITILTRLKLKLCFSENTCKHICEPMRESVMGNCRSQEERARTETAMQIIFTALVYVRLHCATHHQGGARGKVRRALKSLGVIVLVP